MSLSSYVNCDGCPYKDRQHLEGKMYEIRNSPLLPELNNSFTLLVFQSPGLNEWINGHPISSNSKRSTAHKIERAFSLAGKARIDFDITNSIQCYTGKLPEDGISKPRDRPVNQYAIERCSNRLQDLISSKKYKKIVIFGRVAQKAISKIDLSEGTLIEYSAHPSARGVSAKIIARLL